MFVMRMCETGQGTWLLAPHTGQNYRHGDVSTRLYVMRSADGGVTWTLLPHPRPEGWVAPGLIGLRREGLSVWEGPRF